MREVHIPERTIVTSAFFFLLLYVRKLKNYKVWMNRDMRGVCWRRTLFCRELRAYLSRNLEYPTKCWTSLISL